MPTLRRNVIANLLGNAWTSILQLAVLPLYLRLLGPEAFGIVAVFATIQSLASVYDIVLGATLNREVAKVASGTVDPSGSYDLIRSLEVAYWVIGALASTAIALLAPAIATRWLHVNTLPSATVTDALRLAAAVLCVQWPAGFYGGGLLALQRQVRYNVLNGVAIAVRSIGAVLVVAFVARSIIAFFLWQLAIGVIQTTVFALAFFRSLRPRARGRFNQRELRRVSGFITGMTGISVSTLLLTQADNVIVSKLLPLSEFGYYVVAATLGLGLTRLVSPVSVAVFPRFNEMVTREDRGGVTSLFHSSCQLVALLILPAAAVASAFSGEILLLWTRDQTTASHERVVLSLLVIGTACNGLVTIPYLVQISFGQTKLPLQVNALALVLLVPLVTVTTMYLGAPGAALGWLTLNVCYLLLSSRLTLRQTLPGELRRWYSEDVLRPLLGATIAALLLRAAFPTYGPTASVPRLILELVLAMAVTSAAVAICTPLGRTLGGSIIKRIRVGEREYAG